jgi:hypothetical protein
VAWIRERLDSDASMALLLTRNYLPKQTALYLKWLTFRDDAFRDEFLSEWPHYRIEYQIEKLERERKELAEKLQARIDRGGYDLSKISADQRLTVASRYVEAASKIHDLDWQVRYLREGNTAIAGMGGEAAKLRLDAPEDAAAGTSIPNPSYFCPGSVPFEAAA